MVSLCDYISIRVTQAGERLPSWSGGPWIVTSRPTIVITHIRGLIAPLITTHEPPSTLILSTSFDSAHLKAEKACLKQQLHRRPARTNLRSFYFVPVEEGGGRREEGEGGGGGGRR